MATDGAVVLPSIEPLDPSQPHTFTQPSKKINEGQDVTTFLTSLAYRDIMTFILQLNRSMVPSRITRLDGSRKAQAWPLNSNDVEFSESVRRLQLLLSKLDSIIDEVPPDTGPRRFGNISFRKFFQVLESRISGLLQVCLPSDILQRGAGDESSTTAETELTAYFLGSFGSSQRLDYGTGHELSFLAFLGCLWKLNCFPKADPGVEERGIVLGVIEPYMELVRRLIKTYTLEPAGSHGVWGLDDHSFLPYMLGSAQLSPPISESDPIPVEGSLSDAPDPSDVTRQGAVSAERKRNMYFSAIGFIYDVKKGPFWEHSPMLYDISGIKDGWGKINKGMIKMYNAEVLSKFPVVQHFPFGSLFRWERDPTAVAPPPTAHMAARPEKPTVEMYPPRAVPNQGARAPWAKPPTSTRLVAPGVGTSAPWATSGPGLGETGTTRAPWASSRQPPSGSTPGMQPTKAPWAKQDPSS